MFLNISKRTSYEWFQDQKNWQYNNGQFINSSNQSAENHGLCFYVIRQTAFSRFRGIRLEQLGALYYQLLANSHALKVRLHDASVLERTSRWLEYILKTVFILFVNFQFTHIILIIFIKEHSFY